MADAKICRACGEDCSQRARTKDSKGRYMCKACFERLKRERAAGSSGGTATAATKPASTVALRVDDVDASPDWLFDDIPDAVVCDGCGAHLRQDTIVCLSCGFNRQTGRRTEARVIETKEPKEPGAIAQAVANRGAEAGVIGMWTLGALGGGLIGALVWGLIAYQLKVEIRWLAIGVGALTGGGTVLAGRGYAGALSGGIAAIVAVLAIMGGRYAAISSLVDDAIAEADLEESLTMQDVTDTDAIWYFADEIAAERAAAGDPVRWPPGVTLEDAIWPEDYPRPFAQQVAQRWSELPAAEQQRLRQAVLDEMNADRAEFADTVNAEGGLRDVFVEEGFWATFGFRDIVFFAFAIIAAFVIGSGGSLFGD